MRWLAPLLLGLLLAGCVSGSVPPPATSPAPTAAPSVDEGPPLPIPPQRPAGKPQTGLERAKGLPGAESLAKTTDNPVPWSEKDVMEGQMLYREHCARCHCWDGDGDGPASVGLSPPPRNFAKVEDYRFGTGDLALFRTVRYGIPHSPMFPAPAELSDEQVWKIVHFLRVLQVYKKP